MALKLAPTIISPSHSIRASWWPAFAPSCAAPVKAVPAQLAARHDEILNVGEIEMSMATRTVTCGGTPVDLTSVEFNVLELLLRHAGNVVTREQIAEVALGRPLNAFDRSVDVHVSRLRKKLGSFPGTDDLIRPIRGIGYFISGRHAGAEPRHEPPAVLEDIPAFLGRAGLAPRRALHASSLSVCTPSARGGLSLRRQLMPQLGPKLAADVMNSGSNLPWTRLLKDISLDNRARYWLLDGNGVELATRPAPASLAANARQACKAADPCGSSDVVWIV